MGDFPYLFCPCEGIGFRHSDDMARFKGQATYSIDAKGRVAIPAKMRSAMNPEANNTFVLTRGFEECIFLYPLDEWKVIEEEIGALNRYDREARHLQRTIFRWAEEAVLDRQGRVGLPKPLLDFAKISDAGDDKVVVVGAYDRIEIWSPAVFDAYLNAQTEDYETLAERVMTH